MSTLLSPALAFAAAERKFESYLPEDTRTDAQIEADAAERVRMTRARFIKQQRAMRLRRLFPTTEPLSEGEQKTAHT